MKTTTARAPHRAPKQTPDLAAILLRIERKVDSLKALQTAENKEYLTTLEACQYLGCTRALIYQLQKSGRITKLKKDNGRTYYRQDELKAYIERNGETVATTSGNDYETESQYDSAQA